MFLELSISFTSTGGILTLSFFSKSLLNTDEYLFINFFFNFSISLSSSMVSSSTFLNFSAVLMEPCLSWMVTSLVTSSSSHKGSGTLLISLTCLHLSDLMLGSCGRGKSLGMIVRSIRVSRSTSISSASCLATSTCKLCPPLILSKTVQMLAWPTMSSSTPVTPT